MTKAWRGNYLEDFKPGSTLVHATPRTVTEADAALNIGLTGSRFSLFSSDAFAQACGLPQAPIDPLLAFHVVFGKTVPDISLNAVANLGYAQGRFLKLVYPGDTLSATSEILGLKENSSGATGVVWLRSKGVDQMDEAVLDYVRWVMVNKKNPAEPLGEAKQPHLAPFVAAKDLIIPEGLDFSDYDFALAGEKYTLDDYEVGECIDHIDGMCVEEAEHQIATRLYQNTAKVHFNQFEQASGRFGRRLIYGGVAISIARALSFNGLANAQLMLAINGGKHVNPLFAGDTVFAWSEILAKEVIRPGVGALRIRLVATKNQPCAEFPSKDASAKPEATTILDFDYWAAIPA
ncbi:MAG: MaoC family dehydratase [Caulobacterales bacterium]